MKKPLKIAVIAGEESGDLLAADVLSAYAGKIGRDIELIGVGGAHLQKLGLKSFFDREDIALMGIAEVLKKLPRLFIHIRRLSAYLAKERPDFLLIVDCPDFTHRVARRLRKLAPGIPIVQYVAPSVWAWRPQRAKAMRAYIDLLLVILPFEPKILTELNGPKSVYVGHRLLSYPPVQKAYEAQLKRWQKAEETKKLLVILPGSRNSEIKYLMPVFGQAAAQVKKDNPDLEIILPTLPHLAEKISKLAEDWVSKPNIVTSEEGKWAAFERADAALAASGTVSLELALCSVPTVLSYKADWFATKFILPRITVWSAALPNIITDEPVIPEYFNEFVRAPMLAHQINSLLHTGIRRTAQLEGFKKLRAVMHTDIPTSALAAQALIDAELK